MKLSNRFTCQMVLLSKSHFNLECVSFFFVNSLCDPLQNMLFVAQLLKAQKHFEVAGTSKTTAGKGRQGSYNVPFATRHKASFKHFVFLCELFSCQRKTKRRINNAWLFRSEQLQKPARRDYKKISLLWPGGSRQKNCF